MSKRILFVLTSADTTIINTPTGWYLPEAAHPYYELAPKYGIDFASPKGANPPVDPSSVKLYEEDNVKFLQDPTVQAKLAGAKKLKDVNVADYAAVFYVGGQGPVLDLATDEDNLRVATEFYRSGKVVSAVCHGPAALVGVTDAQGVNIFKGKRVTSLTTVEEQILKSVDNIPWLPEDRLRELGGLFECAAEPWGSHVVVDGNLITGQNPASGKALSGALDKLLSA